MEEEIRDFLNQRDYDIRKFNDARWIDQKCTMDVLSIVADCIIEYLGEDTNKQFTVKDIWFNEYTVENVQAIFKKPNPEKKAKNEYDKWFGQPLKLLGYSNILTETKVKGKNTYRLNNKNLLRYIAQRESNTHKFLCIYIEKVLSDSDLLDDFNLFFERQNKNAYKELKDKFTNYTIQNTKINGKTECGRIFTKVLNPLAYEKNKRGTNRGKFSKNIITRDMLMYNRINWRDEISAKPKDMTRNEYESRDEIDFGRMQEYRIQRAKNQVRAYNTVYRDGKSEVKENGSYPENAIHMHHIFPKADFPIIADYMENIIALTPTQHYCNAHPNGNTGYIDKEYQYTCLVSKIKNIQENLATNNELYDFECMTFVLDVGLETNEFSKVENMDFNQVLRLIDTHFQKEQRHD